MPGTGSRSPRPVIVHLLAKGAEELEKMARRLENVEGVNGLEVGMVSDANADMVIACTQAASGELPVIIQLPWNDASIWLWEPFRRVQWRSVWRRPAVVPSTGRRN